MVTVMVTDTAMGMAKKKKKESRAFSVALAQVRKVSNYDLS